MDDCLALHEDCCINCYCTLMENHDGKHRCTACHEWEAQ